MPDDERRTFPPVAGNALSSLRRSLAGVNLRTDGHDGAFESNAGYPLRGIVNGSDWRALLRALEDVPLPPSVIVLRSSPDPKLWADVLTAGGFDVVSQPFEFDSLLWTVLAAHRRWERKREI